MSWERRVCVGHPLGRAGGCGFEGTLEVHRHAPPCPVCGGWTEQVADRVPVPDESVQKIADEEAFRRLSVLAEERGWVVELPIEDGCLSVRVRRGDDAISRAIEGRSTLEKASVAVAKSLAAWVP